MAEEDIAKGREERDILGWSKTPWGAIVLYLVTVIAIVWIVCNVEFVRTFSQMIASQRWFLWSVFGPPFVIWGLWFAGRRLDATRKQIEKQTTSIQQQEKAISVQANTLDQQRFFEAINLLDSKKEFLQRAGLSSISQLGESENFQYLQEFEAIFPKFIEHVADKADTTGKRVRNGENPHDVMQDEHKPITEIANAAFSTFLEIVAHHSYDFVDQPWDWKYWYQFNDINLNELSLPEEAKLFSISFSGCRLRNVDFSGATLNRVSFARPNLGRLPADLTNSNFTDATLTNVEFGNSDISGIKFGENSQIEASVLSECIYSVRNLPTGLPPGTILQYPYSSSPDLNNNINYTVEYAKQEDVTNKLVNQLGYKLLPDHKLASP